MSRYKTIDEGVFVVRPLVNVDERYKAKTHQIILMGYDLFFLNR